MTTLPKLQDVMEALKAAIEVALVSSGAPGTGQVYIGWPTGSEEVQKLGQPTPEGSITIFPFRSRNVTRYSWEPCGLVAPVNNLTASVSGSVCTFGGVSDQAYNVHSFFSGLFVDGYCQTTPGETLANVAIGFAAAINALNATTLSATPSGNAVIATRQFQAVNVGSSGQYYVEEFRVGRTIMVGVWLNDPSARWSVVDAILTNIGSSSNHFLTLTDGSLAYIKYLNDGMDDSSISSYSMLAHYIYFDVEYGQLQSGAAYQIGSLEVTPTIGSISPGTLYYG